MPRIARSVSWLVGRTPLVELARLPLPEGARLAGKLEFFNPTGSNKDRAVLAMIRHRERTGALRPGGTIVDASAGDMGVSMAVIARDLGYHLVLTMPESRAEHGELLQALGVEVVCTPPENGMAGAMAEAEQRARRIPGAVVLQPFSNRANAEAHERTAREIWEDTDGLVAAVVCPVGTGGTAAGCAAFFRDLGTGVQVLGVEPKASAVLTGGEPGRHGLSGLGAGFVPAILDPDELAEVIAVDDDEALAMVEQLAAEEALLCGPASGAVVAAAARVCSRPQWRQRLVVAILPDQGPRHPPRRAAATGALGGRS